MQLNKFGVSDSYLLSKPEFEMFLEALITVQSKLANADLIF